MDFGFNLFPCTSLFYCAENASSMMIPIIAAVVVLVLILGAAIGFADYKRRKVSDSNELMVMVC